MCLILTYELVYASLAPVETIDCNSHFFNNCMCLYMANGQSRRFFHFPVSKHKHMFQDMSQVPYTGAPLCMEIEICLLFPIE